MGGDKKLSHRYFERGGHGKTVIAECTLTDEAMHRVLKTTRGRARSTSRSSAPTAPSPRGCSRSRSRPRRRSQPCSSPPARTSAWSAPARWRTGPRCASTAASRRRSGWPGLEVATIGGGTTLPSARSWLDAAWAARARARSTASRRSSPPRRSRSRSRPRPRWRPRARRTSTGPLRARRAAVRRIPPHHDPACWGCGRKPGRHPPSPARRRRESSATSATFSFRERHQAGPGIVHGGLVGAALDEACGLLATWHRFPRGDRADLRPLPPAGSHQPRARGCRLGDRQPRPAHPRGRRAPRRAEILAEARGAFLHVPLEHFLAIAGGPRRGRSLAPPTSLRRGIARAAASADTSNCMERCEGYFRLENRRCDRTATRDVRATDGQYYQVCEHHARQAWTASVAHWNGSVGHPQLRADSSSPPAGPAAIPCAESGRLERGGGPKPPPQPAEGHCPWSGRCGRPEGPTKGARWRPSPSRMPLTSATPRSTSPTSSTGCRWASSAR